MQQTPSLSRALTLLRQVLPPQASLEVERSEDQLIVAHLRSEQLPPMRLCLRSGPEAPGRSPEGCVMVVVFDRVPSSENERLRAEGRSFIDLQGTVHIEAPGLYLDRELSPAPTQPSRRDRLDPYTDGASRVVRTLLTSPTAHRWSIRALARKAEVHPSTASRAMKVLRDRDLVRDDRPGERRRSRVWIPEPERLLEDWTRSYRWDDNERLRVAAPMGSPRKFMDRLPGLLEGRRWALTGPAAASLHGPHVPLDQVHVYLAPETALDAVAMEHGWTPSPSGKLSLVLPRYRDSVWIDLEEVEGLPTVGPVQLVLDLWHYPVRGREQARHLIDQVLRPVWESDHVPG